MYKDLNRVGNRLIKLNKFIRSNCNVNTNSYRYDYHMAHINLVTNYAIEINRRLGASANDIRYTYIGLGHDLLKEHGFSDKIHLRWNGADIPMDLNIYVRSNIDILDKFGIGDYFNSDCSLHGLSAGIFMFKEMGIKDPAILYPVFFHSCPVMEVYDTLPKHIQTMVDVTLLADKLSSNWLRINMIEKDVSCDLDLALFGASGKEFNYSLALVMARLISQSKTDGELSKIATDAYVKRLKEFNPAITKVELGGKSKWPKRNLRLRMLLRPF